MTTTQKECLDRYLSAIEKEDLINLSTKLNELWPVLPVGILRDSDDIPILIDHVKWELDNRG